MSNKTLKACELTDCLWQYIWLDSLARHFDPNLHQTVEGVLLGQRGQAAQRRRRQVKILGSEPPLPIWRYRTFHGDSHAFGLLYIRSLFSSGNFAEFFSRER